MSLLSIIIIILLTSNPKYNDMIHNTSYHTGRHSCPWFWLQFCGIRNGGEPYLNGLQSSLCRRGIAPQKQSPDFQTRLGISSFTGFQWVVGAYISLEVERWVIE